MVIVIKQIKRDCVALHDIEHLLRLELLWDTSHYLGDLPQLAQPSLIDRVPVNDVPAQHIGCPASELNAPLGFDSISYRDNDIQVVQFCPVPLAIGRSCQGFLDNCVSLKLALLKAVVHVEAYVLLGCVKQLGHLSLA